MYKVNYNSLQRKRAGMLRKELISYEKEGTLLYLGNSLSKVDEIVSQCVFSEQNNYMRDFISDESEHITEIHFIRIS